MHACTHVYPRAYLHAHAPPPTTPPPLDERTHALLSVAPPSWRHPQELHPSRAPRPLDPHLKNCTDPHTAALGASRPFVRLSQGDASKLNPEHHNELAFDPARRDRKGPGVGCVWMERFVDAEKDFGPPDVQLYEFASLPSPRVVKTHALPMLLLGREPPTHKMHFAHQGEAASLPPPLLPQGVRVIYLSREPKDVVLSSYHHPAGATSPANTGWPLDAFVALWAAGKVEHGEWSDHVCAWARYAAAHELHEQGRKASGKATDPRRVTRFLEVRYEELQADLRSEVRKVADLLGMGDADDALIDAVVAASGFDAMKRQANNAPHLREGKAGGGGAAFGRQLTKEFDATFRERVAKCGLKL